MSDERATQLNQKNSGSYAEDLIVNVQPSSAENKSSNRSHNTLIFFGNGPVAAESLAFLVATFNVELIVTKRRPAHHKDPAPVEELAKAHGVPYVLADTKAELETLIREHKPQSPIGVVIDYGVIISEPVIDYFPLGIINSHFSLLPEWRGADPITFSLLSGQIVTGVSLMLIDTGLDTGPLLATGEYNIDTDETNQSLTANLITLSNALLAEIIPKHLEGAIVAMPQTSVSERPVTYSRKLTKQDGWLNTNKPASVLEREVRAFSEWPKSKLILGDNLTVIVTKTAVISEQLPPGEIQITPQKEIRIGTTLGSLELIELMPLGKQKMTAAAFLNGYSGRVANTVN